MASYDYPIDVKDLVARAKKRGGNFVKYLGLEDELRDDLELTTIVWGLSTGWFPLTAARKWHGAVDIGLPDMPGDTFKGTKVVSIGDGDVVFTDEGVQSREGYDFGRVIIKYAAPDGTAFYAQYMHLDEVKVSNGQKLKKGDLVGTVGWHGSFPHLQFSVASLVKIGADKDLVPEADRNGIPGGDPAWNVLRVKTTLDAIDWPTSDLRGKDGFVYNPIEMVRFCKGEPYKHDIGRGSIHGVDVLFEGEPQLLEPGVPIEITVPSILRSSALKSIAALATLAQDPNGTPIAKGHKDAAVVKAIQQALKACEYDLGRFGPNGDGIDGDFGSTCETIVKKFQTTQLEELIQKAGPDGFLGRKTSDIKGDGKVDWLTLIGLDLIATAHVDAPAPIQPVVTEDPPPPAPVVESTPPPAGTYTFDGKNKKLSLNFGMRMYKSLLKWEYDGTKGVGYSSCSTNKSAPESHYGLVIPLAMSPEWPNLGLTADSEKEIDGKKYPVYKFFGVNWVGTNFTNCCCSQMAAFAYAVDGKNFAVKKADGTVTTYDVRKDNIKVDSATAKGGKTAKRGTLVLFEQTFVNGGLYYVNDKALYGSAYGGMLYAAEFLGIGEHISGWTTDQATIKKMRVGDLAHYEGHAWMVGDVRYAIWFEGNATTTPNAILDQSSFIDGASGKLVKMTGTSTKNVTGRALMTAADCDWVIGHEADFEKRITDFLAATKLVDPSTNTEKKVAKIEVAHWRVFSANGTLKTAHAKVYEWDADKKKYNEGTTSSTYGITRPFCDKVKKVCFGRLYGPAS